MATISASAAIGGYARIAFGEETTWGTAPAATKVFRTTACTLNLERDTLESKELRSDRQIADVRLGTYNVSGDLDCEVIVGGCDDMLAAALFGAWSTNVLKAGIIETAVTIEKGYTNISQFHVFTGCMVDKWTLSCKPNEMVTSKFSFKGRTMTQATSAIATPSAATTNSPCDAFTGALKEGGSTIAYITSVDLTLDNGIAAVPVVGSKFPYRLAPGRSKLTGNMSAVFVDAALLTKFINETASSLEIVLTSGAKSFTVLIPKVIYTGAKSDINTEQVLQLEMPFYGVLDSTTENTNLKITRVP